jgi:TPR repeat protein
MTRFPKTICLSVLFLLVSCASDESKVRSRADAGDSDAEYRLARMYWEGKDVAQDRNEALKWYGRAAEHGDTDAQVSLARLYMKGHGVPQSYIKAIKLLERAAARKSAEAQYLLGLIYWEGRGVPRDKILAHMWFNLAASQGHQLASSLRDVVATEMVPDQLAEAHRLAVEHSTLK